MTDNLGSGPCGDCGGLWVYGAIPPEPAGGVSTFVERLVYSPNLCVQGVVDPYYGKKYPIPVEHVVSANPGILGKILVLSKLFKLAGAKLLVNGSNPRSVIAMYPFLLFRRGATLLILHHGDLKLGGIPDWLFRVAVRQYQAIGCLSEAQRDFYLSKGVASEKLTVINSYLPVVRRDLEGGAGPLADVLNWLDRGEGRVVLSSGAAREFYHHEWLLDEIVENGSFEGVRYLVCCYGPETSFLKKLQEKAALSERVMVVFGLSPVEFDQVLGMADLYIRPSDVDSFGIAAWDASAKGVIVVASDVCERPPGAAVHSVGDRGGFLSSLKGALRAVKIDKVDKSAVNKRVGVVKFIRDNAIFGH